MVDITKSKILITGGNGFLGTHLVENLRAKGVSREMIFTPRASEYDLREKENAAQVVKGMDIVIHLAANVGGIGYNQQNPGSLFYDNLLMGVHMLEQARVGGVRKFVAIGTVCAYPNFTPVPFKEEDLWNGYPEVTNAPYGLAKKMLLVQAQAYRQQYDFNAIYLLPANLYGPRDNFDPASSHVIPALIRKFVEAQAHASPIVTVWGTGTATREFLFVQDAAEGIVLATQKYDKADPINLGSSFEISIKELANTIKEIVGFTGEVVWDTSKPDGQPKRHLDVSQAKQEFSFSSATTFKKGLEKTIKWYLQNH